MNKMTWPSDINRIKIAWESALLAAICAVDLASTMWLITKGFARESNPILDFYLSRGGAISFAGVKLLLFLGPLFLLELIREHRPRFVRALLRVGIVAYVAIYVIGSLAVNRASLAAAVPGFQPANSAASFPR